MRSKEADFRYILLLLISPLAYFYINFFEDDSVTTLDKINSWFLWGVFLAWLVIGPSLPDDSVILTNLLVFSFLTLIWLVFWLLPWLQFALLLLVSITSLISIFTAESYIGQFLVFIAAIIWAVITLGLTVSEDSLFARYWRMNWMNPSPLEKKTGVAMSPYSRPRKIENTDSSLNDNTKPNNYPDSPSGPLKNSLNNPLKKLRPMQQYKLEKRLISIGERVFIDQYYLFRDYASKTISAYDAIEQLASNQISDKNDAKRLLDSAANIFEQNEERAALMLVTLFNSVDQPTKKEARRILDSLY